MNYLSHGYRFLDNPLFMAGTAVPDWLSVVDRKVRARKRLVEPVVAATESEDIRQIGLGILQHHQDDDIFHRCEPFQQLEGQLGQIFRQHMPDKYDHRPGFLGHIVAELMLDQFLAERDPTLLDRFYATMELVDAELIQVAVNQMAAKKTDELAWFIGRFRAERFLYDYGDDDTLYLRLNQVLKRVRLPKMEDKVKNVFSEARRLVNKNAETLLNTVTAADTIGE